MEVICDNWSYKMCKVPVKLLPPTNQHPLPICIFSFPIIVSVLPLPLLDKNRFVVSFTSYPVDSKHPKKLT